MFENFIVWCISSQNRNKTKTELLNRLQIILADLYLIYILTILIIEILVLSSSRVVSNFPI